MITSRPFKILTGSAVMRAVTLVTILAGVTAAAVPANILGLTALAIGVTMDTVQTYNLRKTRTEHSLLKKNRNARSKQEAMLYIEPKLAEALGDELYRPERGNEKSMGARYNENPQLAPGSFGKAMIVNSISSVQTVATAVTAPTLTNIGKLLWKIKGLYSDTQKHITKKQVGLEFKREINAERAKPDTPGYNDITELGIKTREQRIQTMAISKLMTNGNYRTSTPEQIRAEFKGIKQEIASRERAYQNYRGVVNTTKRVGEAFLRAHNPFSGYTDLEKLRDSKKKDTPLTKAVEAKNSVVPQEDMEKLKNTKTKFQKGKKRRSKKVSELNRRKPRRASKSRSRTI